MRDVRRSAMVGAVGALMALTLVGAGTLVLRSDGIEFPDGTMQTTAYGGSLEFVGTTTPILGDAGVLAMTRKCQAEVGAGTRMCSSTDVMNSVEIPPLQEWQSSKAWVRPVFLVQRDTSNVADASGYIGTPEGLSCRGWSISGLAGLTIQNPTPTQEGQFITENCDAVDVGIACCG